MVEMTKNPTARPPRYSSERYRWGTAAGVLSLLTLAATIGWLLLPPVPSLLAMPRWFAVAAAGLGVALWAGWSAGRSRPGPADRTIPRPLLASAWIVSGALLVVAVGIAFDVVGIAMWVVAVVSGQAEVIAVPVDPAGALTRTLALASGVAWGVAALSGQRQAGGRCAACGRRRGDADGPGVPAAVRAARPAGYAAGVLALGYGALKLQWGLGGDIGLSRPDALGEVSLWSPGLGDTAVLSAIGVALALALVRPWGRRLPRWMPIAGAVLGSAMLIPVGLLSSLTTIPAALAGQITESPVAPWVYVGIYPWFLAWGLTLAAAAWSYAYRTRGSCPQCVAPGS